MLARRERFANGLRRNLQYPLVRLLGALRRVCLRDCEPVHELGLVRDWEPVHEPEFVRDWEPVHAQEFVRDLDCWGEVADSRAQPAPSSP